MAKKSQKPVYVTNSMSLASAGMGGTVEEEMEAFKQVAQVVLDHMGYSLNVTTMNGIPSPIAGS